MAEAFTSTSRSRRAGILSRSATRVSPSPREVERRSADRATTAWWKEERGERIFIDFNQNARDRTIAAAYSARKTPIATVSTPVTWDELRDVHPDDCTIATVPGLLADRGDPMEAMHDKAFALDVLLEMWEKDLAAGLGDLPYPPNYPQNAR